MAKKRFTDNLSGLFEEPAPGPATPRADAPSVSASSAPQDEERVDVEVPAPTPRARKKLSSKGFTADLDAFLSDSFAREDHSPASPTSPAPASAPQQRPGSPAPRPRRRRTGLDLLIRSTVSDEQRESRGPRAGDTKRVTLIFNKEHLATLKEQAKERGMYLKDVVQEMVAEYLEK